MIAAVDPASAARIAYCNEVRNHIYRLRGTVSDYGSLPIARWDGGQDGQGHEHTAIWPRIAAFAEANHLDIGRLFRCVFQARRTERAYPMPDMCIGAHVIALYRQNAAQTWSRDIAAESQNLNRQKAQFASGLVSSRPMRELLSWSDQQVLRSVLADSHLSMSPLFRYCAALSAGADDLAEEFRQTAIQQYYLQPEMYQAAWGNFIPPDFPGETDIEYVAQESSSCRPRQDRKGRRLDRDSRSRSWTS